jgi:hypothetical protein
MLHQESFDSHLVWQTKGLSVLLAWVKVFGLLICRCGDLSLPMLAFSFTAAVPLQLWTG